MLNSTHDAPASTSVTRSATARDETADARRWFLENVARARKTGMFTIRAPLTPALARVLIKHHMPAGSNRRLRVMKMQALASEIAAGRWNPNTHQGLAFAEDGTVNDGQHRIHAADNAGIAIEILMTFGQPRETFEVIDLGMTSRTASDLLGIAGLDFTNNGTAAAIARMLIGLRAQIEGVAGFGVAMRQPAATLLDFAAAHEVQLRRAVQDGSRIASGIKAKVSPSNCGAAIFLIREAGAPDPVVEEFIEALATGAGLTKASPILAAREGLRTGAFGSHIRTGTDRRAYEAGAIITAWNLWRQRRNARGASSLRISGPREFPGVVA